MSNIFSLLTSSQGPVKANWGAWIKQAVIMAIMVAAIMYFFPTAIPYSFFQLWHTTGTPLQWVIASWPILLWAVCVTALQATLTLNSRADNIRAEGYLADGLWLSLRAGLMEEIVFRWLVFMWSIVVVKVMDFILGGFIFDHGLIWVIYSAILSPIADFCTFGLLHTVLGAGSAWFIASGVLVANARFRNGHKYQGLFGLINSWFIGMYFFYLMFTFGLVAAIVVHFIYDAFIFSIGYIDRAQERARNLSNDK